MKRKISLVAAVLAMIFAIIVAVGLLNESLAQAISVVFVVGVSAVVLARNLEKTGMRTVLLMAQPLFLGMCKALSETEFSGFASQLCNAILEFLCNVARIESSVDVGNETAVIVLFWLIFIFALLVSGEHDHTAMGIHKGDGDTEFREKNFSEKSAAFCKALRQRLETLNRETDWNESLFTPIDAEVEVNIKGKHKKKYADLLRCLKKTRRGVDVFLVLGDPGAGKSVSLRKLCLDLLDESKRTKKIPVYVNLKKWNKNWSLDMRPNKNDLTEFVKEVLYENGDIFTDGFLDSYFDKMLEDGRWYFVFDSFDEMPCLMGKQNCHELIDHISELLYQFLTAENQSGGVIASRLYKAPSEAIRATTVLRIQEFSDIKIRTMLKKYLNHPEKVVKELFGKREDLVVLCRNPFYLTLLINFIREKDMTFPKNQMALYSNFVESRLEKCAGKLESEHFLKEDVHTAAKKLSVFFQDSTKYGLECPAQELYQQPGGPSQEYWRKALKILEYAKICRFGGANETVSFVHRRFQEFFLVENIIEHQQNISDDEYSSIVHVSGMRDALVLYCEVADEGKAREIAKYCWNVIQENIKYRTSIFDAGGIALANTLEFMAEAFRNRKSALSDFVEEFEQLVMESMDNNSDFIIRLALANSMVLFDQNHLQEVVLKVFQLRNRWLNDAVVKNCRLIHQLDDRVEKEFSAYFFTLDRYTFLRRFRNTSFSLSISKSFRYVRIVHASIFLRYVILMATGVFIVAAACWAQLVELGRGVVQQPVQVYPSYSSSSEFLFIAKISILIVLIMSSSLPRYRIYKLKKKNVFANRVLQPLLICLEAFPSMTIVLVWLGISFGTASTAAYVWLVLLAITLAAAQWLTIIHDAYFEVKRNGSKLLRFLRFLAIIMPIGVIEILFTVFIVIPIIDKFFPVIYIVAAIAIGIAAIILLFTGLVLYCKDRYWVTHQPNIQHIDRARLETELNKLHFTKWKRLYAEQLLHTKTKLVGVWPSGHRPGQEDDDLEGILAKLDCLSLEFYSCIF